MRTKWKYLTHGLSALLCVGMLAGCAGTPSAETTPPASEPSEPIQAVLPASPFSASEEGAAQLKGTGLVTYSFTEEQPEEWADKISAVYVHDAAVGGDITAEDLLPAEKYTISTVKMMLDSDLFPVGLSSTGKYEVVIQSEGYDDFQLSLSVTNLTSNTFTIRTLDADGTVLTSKEFTYDELAEMCTSSTCYSFGCVMHGVVSARAEGVYLTDLFEAAGVEFAPGMSLAIRVTDAPLKVEATEPNSSEKTGEIVENPEKYWMKPRFATNYKHTYEELFGRTRYFLTGMWEDETMTAAMEEDAGRFDFALRELLASKPEYMTEVAPMIALKYTTLQYTNDASDIRTYDDDYYDLTANEMAFRFLYGLALDDDPVVNVTAYDDEAKCYPVVESPENAGKTAIEEGQDACGLSARESMHVFGIDIFTAG